MKRDARNANFSAAFFLVCFFFVASHVVGMRAVRRATSGGGGGGGGRMPMRWSKKRQRANADGARISSRVSRAPLASGLLMRLFFSWSDLVGRSTFFVSSAFSWRAAHRQLSIAALSGFSFAFSLVIVVACRRRRASYGSKAQSARALSSLSSCVRAS